MSLLPPWFHYYIGVFSLGGRGGGHVAPDLRLDRHWAKDCRASKRFVQRLDKTAASSILNLYDIYSTIVWFEIPNLLIGTYNGKPPIPLRDYLIKLTVLPALMLRHTMNVYESWCSHKSVVHRPSWECHSEARSLLAPSYTGQNGSREGRPIDAT